MKNLILAIPFFFISVSCLRWFNLHSIKPPPIPKSINDVWLTGTKWQFDSIEVEGKKFNLFKFFELEFHKTNLEGHEKTFYSISILKDNIKRRMDNLEHQLDSLISNDFFIVHPKKQLEYAVLSHSAPSLNIYFSWWETKRLAYSRTGGRVEDYKVGLLEDLRYLYCDFFIFPTESNGQKDTELCETFEKFYIYIDKIFMDRSASIKIKEKRMVLYNNDINFILKKI